MTTSVTMPLLGESVTEGTVTRWLKREGDHVAADEPLLEVSTDKVDTEVPSPVSGTVLSIKVWQDQTVGIGVELAVIGAADDAAAPAAAEPKAVDSGAAEPGAADPGTPVAPVPDPAPSAAAPPAAGPSARPAEAADRGPGRGSRGAYRTLLVRTLADEHRIDLDGVSGTGAGGRICKADVLAAVGRAAAAGVAPVAATAPGTATAAGVEAVPARPSTTRVAAMSSTDRTEALSPFRRGIGAGCSSRCGSRPN